MVISTSIGNLLGYRDNGGHEKNAANHPCWRKAMNNILHVPLDELFVQALTTGLEKKIMLRRKQDLSEWNG